MALKFNHLERRKNTYYFRYWIIDNVFEQIRRQKDNQALTDAIKKAEYYGSEDKGPLLNVMGEEAAKAFLSGDENYKNLLDKEMARRMVNAYLMFKKPWEILQDTPHAEKVILYGKFVKTPM